jgi:hypothetical protein
VTGLQVVVVVALHAVASSAPCLQSLLQHRPRARHDLILLLVVICQLICELAHSLRGILASHACNQPANLLGHTIKSLCRGHIVLSAVTTRAGPLARQVLNNFQAD